MSFWRQLTRGLRVLSDRTAADRDLGDEIQHYLEESTAAHVAHGLAPDEALRAARREVGGVMSVRDRVREAGWENAIEILLADLRYAARRLRADPGFTAVAVLTLSLGIGATTAILSAVNPILFQPLPYPQPDRIARIWEVSGDGARNEGTFGMVKELSQRSRSFEAIAAEKAWQPTMTGAAETERIDGARVGASYFSVLGVAPALGRDFQESEDRLGGPKVVVLSDGLWRRRFGGDREIVGRQATFDGAPYTILGVMPESFENVLAPQAEIWSPLQYDMSQGRAWGHHLQMVGRLRPGVSAEAATRELNALGNAVIAELRPETYGDRTDFAAVSLQDDLTRSIKPALLALLGAVILLLAIACVNVTNLLLARGMNRSAEFALRAALGGGRRRLIRQVLTESLLLAALGGGVGLAVASVGVRALVALGPQGLPRLGAIAVDGTVFAFCLGMTTIVGLAFGAVPALQTARVDPHAALQSGSRRSVGGRGRTQSALVVAEVALALVLLVGSGLLLRSFERLFAIPAGFDASNRLTMQVQASGPRFESDESTVRFFDQVLDAVRRLPAVETAALTSQLPLSGDKDQYGVLFDPSPAVDPGEVHGSYRYAVSPGYFETMGIPLKNGRLLEAYDRAGTPRVALISESLARRRLPGLDPIGRRLIIGTGLPYSVVGVVGDVKQMSLALAESEAVYVAASQWPFADRAMSLVIRTKGNAPSLASEVRQAVWSVDQDQPIVRVATLDDLLAASASERRFALILFEAFSLVALLLAAAGIYGVLAGSVALRTREIGLRSALGATRRNVVALFLRQGLAVTGLGVAIGLLGAVVASRGLISLLFGVSRLDPATYLGVVVLLSGVALIACAVPAWRAARIDPASTLRLE